VSSVLGVAIDNRVHEASSMIPPKILYPLRFGMLLANRGDSFLYARSLRPHTYASPRLA